MRREAGDHKESELVQEAIARSRRGDTEAVHFLFARYAPAVHSNVLDLVASDPEAQRVAESVFGQLIELVGGYEPREQPFTEWLVGVAREERFRSTPPPAANATKATTAGRRYR